MLLTLPRLLSPTDLHTARQLLASAPWAQTAALTGPYHNLLRMWADT